MHDVGLFDMMLPAFAEILVLSGMFCYLGLHVIRREIIFVDIALAQIAAMGATVGFMLGMAPHSVATWIFSLLFTAIGAAVFSLTRVKDERVPQEAVIGLVYAVAAAVVVLFVAKAPHGAEHIKEMLVGAIIWVKWPTIGVSASVFALVGIFHLLVGKRFLAISDDPAEAFASGIAVRWWDFFFYLTFGIVIAVAVRTAGVLVVFVLLVVPAITAMLLAKRFLSQLLIGWITGTAVSLAGLVASYQLDLPAGPTLAVGQGLFLALLGVVLYLFTSERKGRALARVAVVAVCGTVVLVGMVQLGRVLADSPLAMSRSEAQQLRIEESRATRAPEGGDR